MKLTQLQSHAQCFTLFVVDQIDYKMMAKLFSGLAQVCFRACFRSSVLISPQALWTYQGVPKSACMYLFYVGQWKRY